MKYILHSLIFLAFTVGFLLISGVLNLYPSCAVVWSIDTPLSVVSGLVGFVTIVSGVFSVATVMSAAMIPEEDLEIVSVIWKTFAISGVLSLSLHAWESYIPDKSVCAEEFAAVYGVSAELFREGSGD